MSYPKCFKIAYQVRWLFLREWTKVIIELMPLFLLENIDTLSKEVKEAWKIDDDDEDNDL